MAIGGDLLRKAPLFSELRSEELVALAGAARIRRCRKGTAVFDEGETGDVVLVVVSGMAKVVLYGEAGHEIILSIIEPFDIVGELALLEGATRSASLVTLENTEFFEISRLAFLGIVQSNHAFAMKLIAHLIRSLRKTNEQLRTNCMYESDGQVLRRLFLSSREVIQQEGKVVLRRCPQLQQLANMIGCSRETVSRTMGELERARYIETRKKPRGALLEVVIAERAVKRYLQGLGLPAAKA